MSSSRPVRETVRYGVCGYDSREMCVVCGEIVASLLMWRDSSKLALVICGACGDIVACLLRQCV